jgi:hypothetical protein
VVGAEEVGRRGGGSGLEVMIGGEGLHCASGKGEGTTDCSGAR